MIAPKQFELTNEDLRTSLWLKLKEHLETQLQSARKKNDAVQNIDATNILRGEIRSIKRILALNEPKISVSNLTAANRSSK